MPAAGIHSAVEGPAAMRTPTLEALAMLRPMAEDYPTAMNTPLPRLPEIEQITREIHTLEAHAMQRAQRAIEFKVEIGKRLARAKAILPRGAFVPWAGEEFGWSRMHV